MGVLKHTQTAIGKQVVTQNMLINYIYKEKLTTVPIWDKPKYGVGTKSGQLPKQLRERALHAPLRKW